MEPQRLIRLKGRCGLYTGVIGIVPEIWNNLEARKIKGMEETEGDTVDIHIDDRLGICIVKGRFGAALGYNYITCHHGLTIFVTAPRGAEGSTE